MTDAALKRWKKSPAWVAHRGTTMASSRHHRTCCFDAGYEAVEAQLAEAVGLLRNQSEDWRTHPDEKGDIDAFLAKLDAKAKP